MIVQSPTKKLICSTLPGTAFCSVVMNGGIAVPAGGGGSGGPAGAVAAGGACGAAAGFAAAGAAGFAAAAAAGGAVGCPVAELVSLVVAVWAAVGFAGFGAGGSCRGGPIGAADAPAPGESVRETSPFNGSPGVEPAGLSAAAFAGVVAPASAPKAASGGVFGSSLILHRIRNPQSAIRNPH